VRLKEPAKSEWRHRLSSIAQVQPGCLQRPRRWLIVALLIVLCAANLLAAPADSAHSLELSRPIRPYQFLSALGTRAALFGHEDGKFEAWVYPLKLVRNFHLRFLVDGRIIPAEALARTIVVRPESSTIIYAGDDFAVHETLFVPVHEQGAVIILHVQTSTPLQIEAAFERDFQLEWPAALGGTYIHWDAALRGFMLGEEQKKYAAVVGSPSAVAYQQEYFTSYSSSAEDSLRLDPTQKGRDTKIIVLAGSVDGSPHAEDTYRRLSANYADLLRSSANYYSNYLNQTVGLELPDKQIQQAYDWARVSTIQGLVTNPFLGTGLVAGYRTSGNDARPGFAWFFGRDAFWTSLALDAEGDFATTKTAIEFVGKYQRADGKIPHEISQSASLVDWFKDYPYGYASADGTPLFIIAVDDYVTRSGDLAFAKAEWDRVWKAYEFLRSTYDAQGFAQNLGIGHGWLEGGPLLPVKTEFYQSGLGIQALRALGNLAGLLGKESVRRQLDQDFARERPLLNQAFWSPEKKIFAYALDKNNQRVDTPSVLTTVPMWFGLVDEDKAEIMTDRLADEDFETDWGSRIISSQDPKYSPEGYHFGAVWPLFTGWASVGEYRYHRAIPAYESLRANALLALDGAPGHVTEVLSGDYYESLSTSSPHQIWSAAMVVNPLLRGMMGLEIDAAAKHVRFAPHIPADWTSVAMNNIRVGGSTLQFAYSKSAEGITLQVTRTGTDECTVEFAPALSLRAEILGAELNRRSLPVHSEANSQDQHASVQFRTGSGSETLKIRVRNDFGLSVSSELPPLGRESRGLRVTSETWSRSRDKLTLEVSGASGAVYTLAVWNPGQVGTVQGAELLTDSQGQSGLRVAIPEGTAPHRHAQIVIQFASKMLTNGRR
jgi:glycogen debranching enzyme